LAIAAGSYLPGLVSSPFIGVASVWLWSRLRRATSQHALVLPNAVSHGLKKESTAINELFD
jgi:hypothetical protein